MNKNNTQTTSSKFPIGRVIGLLGGSLVTLIGVCIGLEPETVLWRAAIAAGALMVIGSLMAKVVEFVMA